MLGVLLKLNSELYAAQEDSSKRFEEFERIKSEKSEVYTVLRTIETNLKMKMYALDTIKGRLGQFVLDLGDGSKKIKVDKVKAELLTIQELFIKLRTELDVQMKWLSSQLVNGQESNDSNLNTVRNFSQISLKFLNKFLVHEND
jgi:hypothetical protein